MVYNNINCSGGGWGGGWLGLPYYGNWYRGGWGGNGFWTGFGTGALTSFGLGALGSLLRLRLWRLRLSLGYTAGVRRLRLLPDLGHEQLRELGPWLGGEQLAV